MLADFYGPTYKDAAKHTAKLAAGLSVGSAVYVLGAIPGYAAFSSLSPRGASLLYAGLMGVGSVMVAQKYARQSDFVMSASSAVFVESIYAALASLYAPAEAVAAAALPAPTSAVHGLFDLDNRQAIHNLTRLPLFA